MKAHRIVWLAMIMLSFSVEVGWAAEPITITAPLPNATVFKTVKIIISTNLGTLAGVQVKLDGANLGAELPKAVQGNFYWETSWNTMTAADGPHALTAVARDGAGNLTVSNSVTVTVNNSDQAPPVISGVSATAASNYAFITWATSELADVFPIEFGTSTAYGNKVFMGALTSSHSVRLGGLRSNTLYHYRIQSRDQFANAAVSNDFTFTTQPIPGLMGHWGFDASDPPGADYSGNKNDASFVNGPTFLYRTVGVGSIVLNLDGKDDYADIKATGLSAANKPQTIALWAKYSATPTKTENLVSITNTSANSGIYFGFKGGMLRAWKAGGKNLVSTAVPSVGAWHHYAYTFNGKTHALYVDGVRKAASTATPNAALPSDADIGRNTANLTQNFTGQVDDVRIYNKTLSAAEIAGLYNSTNDTTVPSQVTGLIATAVSSSQINLAWNAAADNIAVVGYSLSRNGAYLGVFESTSYQDTGLTPGTTYRYTVAAVDASNNGGQSAEVSATTKPAPDTAPPTVSITAPASGASVSSTVVIMAGATDNVGVVGVQFKVNGQNLGPENTAAPYAVDWSTVPLADGSYTLIAVARDAAGNQGTSAAVSVTVVKFPTNDFVQAAGDLNVYATPSTSGALLGTQSSGALGVVVNGPVFADGSRWLEIDWSTGPDGWSAEDHVKTVEVLPPPTLTLVTTVVNDNGGRLQAADFLPMIDGLMVSSGVPIFLAAGTHAASLANLPHDYQASLWGGDCAPDGTIALKDGDKNTCTVTTDDIPSSRFRLGDHVIASVVLDVRATPAASGAMLGTQPLGIRGVVIGGPVAGSTWWQVDWEAGPDGWSLEEDLKDFAAPPPASGAVPTILASATNYPLVTVTVTGGPGHRGDKIVAATAGSANNESLAWKYLNGTQVLPTAGRTSATVNLGIIPGVKLPIFVVYRFFAEDGSLLAETTAKYPNPVVPLCVGSRVVTTGSTWVYPSPSSTAGGTAQPDSSFGTIIGGPENNGWTWQIDFETGPDGWASTPPGGGSNIFGSFAMADPSKIFCSGQEVVATWPAEVYSTSSGSGQVLEALKPGSRGQIVSGPVNQLFEIKYRGRVVGWVNGADLKSPPVVVVPSGADAISPYPLEQTHIRPDGTSYTAWVPYLVLQNPRIISPPVFPGNGTAQVLVRGEYPSTVRDSGYLPRKLPPFPPLKDPWKECFTPFEGRTIGAALAWLIEFLECEGEVVKENNEAIENWKKSVESLPPPEWVPGGIEGTAIATDWMEWEEYGPPSDYPSWLGLNGVKELSPSPFTAYEGFYPAPDETGALPEGAIDGTAIADTDIPEPDPSIFDWNPDALMSTENGKFSSSQVQSFQDAMAEVRAKTGGMWDGIDVRVVGDDTFRKMVSSYIADMVKEVFGLSGPAVDKAAAESADQTLGIFIRDPYSGAVYVNGDKFNSDWLAQKGSGLVDKTPAGALLHEVGHVAGFNTIAGNTLDWCNLSTGGGLKCTVGNNNQVITTAKPLTSVSQYGMNSVGEDFAETYVSYFATGGNASLLNPPDVTTVQYPVESLAAYRANIQAKFDYMKKMGVFSVPPK